MRIRQLLLLFMFVIVIVVQLGCSGGNSGPVPAPETPLTPQTEQPGDVQGATAPSGHVLSADTEYYLDGPQQSRPPDGTLKAGMKVTVIEDAGSYCRVRSEDGIVAFIAADAIHDIAETAPEGAP